MKRLLVIYLLIAPYIVSAQVFLNNPDYIYGEGRGVTIEDADKKAFEALTSSLRVDVRVNTTLELNDHNGAVNREYDANINTQTTLRLTGIKQYIDNSFTDGVRVYRYFNAREYVFDHKQKAASYLQLAKDGFYGSQVKGTINLSLGYYYLAYQVLNDEVLSLLDGDNEIDKAQIMHNIKSIIQDVEIEYRPASLYNYDWSDVLNKPTRPSYDSENLHVSAYFRGAAMYRFDFQYWDGVKWSDDYKWNERGDIAEIKCTALLPRNILNLRYRVNFQIIGDKGEKINLPVPNSFYIMKVVEYVNPSDWIQNDKHNNFY